MRIMTTRRITIALLISLVGGSAGVFATGYGADDGIPESFEAAQPLPGDKAMWAMTKSNATHTMDEAITSFTLEVSQPEWIYDLHGDPVWAVEIETREARLQDGDDDGAMEFRLSDASATWWSEDRQLTTGNRFTMGDQHANADPILGGIQTSYNYRSTIMLEPGRETVESCLFQWLPASFHPAARLDDVWCDIFAPDYHIDRVWTRETFESEHPSPTVGALVSSDSWAAIGSSETPWGQSIVLESRARGANLQVWFAESVPYPVQLTYRQDGEEWSHRLVRFQPGQQVDSLAMPNDLPEVRSAEATPVGPSTQGAGPFDFSPSDAMAAALDDDASGVRQWMDKHPGAFVERLSGGRFSNIDSHWIFQWRGGDDRIAFRVAEQPNDTSRLIPGSYLLDHPALKETVVESAEIQELPWSPQDPPRELPTVASSFAAFEALFGTAAHGFTYTWQCDDWLAHDVCEAGAGPAIHPFGQVSTSSGVPYVDDEQVSEILQLVLRVDGGIHSMHEITIGYSRE